MSSHPSSEGPPGRPLPHEMSLDLVHGMLGQVLVDFVNDARLHVGMERLPQICKRPRRGDNDERLRLSLAHELFHRRGNAANEAVLLEVVPVSISDAAAEIRPA